MPAVLDLLMIVVRRAFIEPTTIYDIAIRPTLTLARLPDQLAIHFKVRVCVGGVGDDFAVCSCASHQAPSAAADDVVGFEQLMVVRPDQRVAHLGEGDAHGQCVVERGQLFHGGGGVASAAGQHE